MHLRTTAYSPRVVYLCSDILQIKQLNQLRTVRKYSVGSLRLVKLFNMQLIV